MSDVQYPVRSGTVIPVGLAAVALFVGTALTLMTRTTYDVWAAVFVGPGLFVLSLPILARQAAREQSRRIFWLLAVALALKLAAAIARYYVAFDLYEGVADATGYHGMGVQISERFRAGQFETGLDSLTGTNFINLLSGIVYTVIRPTRLGGFMVFSWLGFWGLFLFYRAFTIAVPEGRRRSYALVLFFLPSLLFWPSSMGKESWMMLSLGVSAYGTARAIAGATTRGLVVAGVGMWMAVLVRPHIAGLAAVALAVAFLVRKPPEGWRQLAAVVKGLSAVVVLAIAVFLVGQSERFLEERGIDTRSGLQTALGQITARTSQGGSLFGPSILESPGRAPAATATVLFRPLIVEANNAQAAVAAVETTFLFLFFVARIRWIWAALRSVRRQPYVAFALAYTALFVFAFSGVANFGLLVRQRVQMWPFILVLFCVPPLQKTTRRASHDSPHAGDSFSLPRR